MAQLKNGFQFYLEILFHDYKNTKLTEILMMTLTPQLLKLAIKKRASHPSSIRDPDLDFRKLVDKLEQAEITMKLEETENLKLP